RSDCGIPRERLPLAQGAGAEAGWCWSRDRLRAMADAGGDRMHAAEREAAILRLIGDSGFVSFRELERRLDASPATIRRDLERLASESRVVRVHGGAKLPSDQGAAGSLTGVPFHQN